MNKKDLTFRYCLNQGCYYVDTCGIMCMTVAFMQEKGYSVGMVGILMFVIQGLSCLLQPMMANRIDKTGQDKLKKVLLCLLVFVGGILCMMLLLPFQKGIYVVMYAAVGIGLGLIVPLTNAVAVYYNRYGYQINYGFGLAAGSFTFSLASLVYGYAIKNLGADWMLWIALLFLIFQIMVVAGYPKAQEKKTENLTEENGKAESLEKGQSLGEFLCQYRLFVISLLAVILIAMVHTMGESYLISIMEPFGGDSSNVGIALFIATFTSTPVMMLYSRIKQKIPTQTFFYLASIFFAVKMLLLMCAGSVLTVYLIQPMQMITYCFLYPTLMYYASEQIDMRDLVKGQAFITASYSIGTALGNFTGGQLVEQIGVRRMLGVSASLSMVGLLIFLVIGKLLRIQKEKSKK